MALHGDDPRNICRGLRRIPTWVRRIFGKSPRDNARCCIDTFLIAAHSVFIFPLAHLGVAQSPVELPAIGVSRSHLLENRLGGSPGLLVDSFLGLLDQGADAAGFGVFGLDLFALLFAHLARTFA